MNNRKAVLETLKAELQERLRLYSAHKSREGGPLDKDMEDQAIQLQNDDVVDSLEIEALNELAQVQNALARIEKGEGDLCESCGDPIDPKRLQAMPYSTLCVDCAALGDKR